MSNPNDLTELVVAARWNEVPVLGLFRDRFPRSRFHLPLAAAAGVKNRPETAVELGSRLPAHRLRLDNGQTAIPIFTRRGYCRDCASRLSWKTDGRAIKTLKLPGVAALEYLQELLSNEDVERVIVNPLSDAELHLSRTDVEAIAQGRHLDSLWFYSKQGRLKIPVAIEGGASVLSSIFKRADRVLQRLTETGGRGEVVEVDVVEDVMRLPPESPLGGLSSALLALVSAEKVDSLELVLSKRGNEFRVDATPKVSERLSSRIRAAAQQHLGASADVAVKLSVQGRTIVVSTSSAPPVERAEESKPSSRPEYTYIPLEPEPLPED